jgi:asparagine synthetase B (glutamine-hydrolysing)
VKVDRMSMMHSLEVRSPFLDYRLVELGLRIPSPLRVNKEQNKYVLRHLARRLLPANVAAAPKTGFGIPLRAWLFASDASSRFRERVLTADRRFPELLRPGGAEALWTAAEGNPALAPAVFGLLAYRFWCAGQP